MKRLLFLIAPLSAACSVSVPELDSGTFACQGPDDCVAGFECVRQGNDALGRCLSDAACSRNEDCPQGQVCDTAARRCAPALGCENDGQCNAVGLACDEAARVCFDPCQGNNSCGDQACTAQGNNPSCVPCSQANSRCAPDRQCVTLGGDTRCRVLCTTNAPCAALAPAQTCDVTAGYCVPVGGAVCPNGVVESGEGCDDGNTTPNDGCVGCVIQQGWNCGGSPSTCLQHPSCNNLAACPIGSTCVRSNGANGVCADDCQGGSCPTGELCVPLDRYNNMGAVQGCGTCPGSPCTTAECIDDPNSNTYPGTTCQGCAPQTCPGVPCGFKDNACGGNALCGADSDGICPSAGDACVVYADQSTHACVTADCGGAHLGAVLQVPGFTGAGTPVTARDVTACVRCSSPTCPQGAECRQTNSAAHYDAISVGCFCPDIPGAAGWRSPGLGGCATGVSFNLLEPIEPSVAIANNGDVWVAFSARLNASASRRIYVRRFPPGGPWQGVSGSDANDGISTSEGSNNTFHPKMMLDVNNRPYVIWVSLPANNVRGMYYDGSMWTSIIQSAINVNKPPASLGINSSDQPIVATTSGSDLVEAFAGRPLTGAGPAIVYNYAGSNPGPAAITWSSGLGDGTRRYVVAFSQPNSGIAIRIKEPSGSSWDPLSPSSGSQAARTNTAVAPVLAVMSDGQPVMAYAEDTGTASIGVRVHAGASTSFTWQGVGGASSETLPLPRGERPAIVVRGGTVYVAYQTGAPTGSSQAVVQQYSGGSWSGLDGSSNSSGVSNAPASAVNVSIAAGPRPPGSSGDQICVAFESRNASFQPEAIWVRCHDI